MPQSESLMTLKFDVPTYRSASITGERRRRKGRAAIDTNHRVVDGSCAGLGCGKHQIADRNQKKRLRVGNTPFFTEFPLEFYVAHCVGGRDADARFSYYFQAITTP